MEVLKKKNYRRHRVKHSKIRANERYGVSLTDQDLKNICGMIRNKKRLFHKKLSTKKSINQVEYFNKKLWVLYSHRHQEIITFLPKTFKALPKKE